MGKARKKAPHKRAGGLTRKSGLKNKTSSVKNNKIENVTKNTKRYREKNPRPEADSKKSKKEMDEGEGFDVAPNDGNIDQLAHFIPKHFGNEKSQLGGDDEEEVNTRSMVKDQNKKKKQKQSGGFQSMGLSYPMYKGIIKKGYKLPTPIQRKTIPLVMDGKDVVGMARTGSGKTGAFLIPMLEKLNVHSSNAIRAVILSPTRELALQTAKFTHELGKFTDLKSSLIVGGDSIENQFAALHENPDILIATPGRLLHVLVEMDIKQMEGVEYVVFDEADRLFEMGFAEQLKEIIQRFPQSRQTVLFSATLPKILVDFATAGLTDPTLIRLDVDTKISDKLKSSFFLVREEDKIACLLHLLHTVVKKDQLTVIFVSTRHHVDYLHELLDCAGLQSSYIYSSLDQTARKLNLSKFRNKSTKILIVTDIAARGIDVPMLDNVINFDFPPRPKIFVHRVGRVARAGRYGNAYSLFVKDELPFVFDLHLFLGRPMKYASSSTDEDEDGVIGTIPQGVIVNELDYIKNKFQTNFNLIASHKVMMNGYKGYVRTREAASVESNKRAKEVDMTSISTHPCFKNVTSETNEELSKLLLDLRKFKPALTVFESITVKKSKEAEHVMQLKRKRHGKVIERELQRQKDKPLVISKKTITTADDDKYIASSFNIQEKEKVHKDENYISHHSSDGHQEKGFSLTSFEKEATSVSMELTHDEANGLKQDKVNKKWDRKRKKFIGVDNPHAKKFKTESGNYIPNSYKTDRYKDWMKNNQCQRNNESEEDGGMKKMRTHGEMMRFKKGGNIKGGGQRNNKRTLKSKDQIVKNRLKENLMTKIRNKSKKGTTNSKTPGRNSKAPNRTSKSFVKTSKKQRRK